MNPPPSLTHVLHPEVAVGAPVETVTVADARYVLESDRGERVYVRNLALRTGSAEDIARLRQDLPVDPARISFRSTPRFETEAARLAALTSHVFVGSGARHPRSVVFDFFQVDERSSWDSTARRGPPCRPPPKRHRAGEQRQRDAEGRQRVAEHRCR